MEDTSIRLTANDQFKRASTNWTQIGLLAAVTLHFGLFVLVRPFEAADMGVVVDELEAVSFPPEVKIPPPPEQIARPATPRVAQVEMSEDITIAPTTFEAVSTENLPPPPAGSSPADRPSFIPFDTNPVLLNGGEVQALLERAYPRTLKDAGIGGRVELWLYVTEQGTVENFEVKTSSGNPLLDEAAGEVVQVMRFTPAKNRDRVTAVWVSQFVTFEVV
ncbi:energy transducer TonB [Candidatus Palauibacter sp.]|uniref:energy transducer TonB n=1 Tax=Candidatus Palauibacter sp. TaxID=3101350 RepID=UPI003AF27A7F